MTLLPGIAIGVVFTLVIGVPLAAFELRRRARRTRAAERRARTAERMAEIGTMTGGLAHEIKNPLSTLGLNAQLLGEAIADLDLAEPDKGRLIRRTQILRQETDRLRDTLADFLRFAGEMRLTLNRADLNEIVEELVDFFAPQAESQRIRLRTELAPGVLAIDADVALLKQAVLNLLINACQAMETHSDGAGG